MFAQATASSIATDRASSTITGLIGPTIASCSPSRRMERSRFVSGYVAASRAAIVEISLLAAAIVAPARSLPIADSAIDPRWFRNEDGGNVSAVHTSAPPAGNRSASGGSTPTIVWRTAPTCSVRPTAEGSPAKCDFQNVYPSMTAGVAPKRYSSGCSARPICGPDAEHGDHLRGGEHQGGGERTARRLSHAPFRARRHTSRSIRGASMSPSSPARRGNSPPARVRHSRPSC